MKRCIKTITFLLSLCLLLGVFAACKKDNGENTGTDTGDQSGAETDYLDIYDNTLYDNDTYSVMTIEGQYENLNVNGSVVDKALFTRDEKMQDYFDIVIQYDYFGLESSEAISAITLAMDGGYIHHAFITTAQNLVRLAMEGRTENLKNVENLNLENPWWCQALNENCEYQGAQFVAAGPFSELFYHAALCLAYNNDIVARYEMPDIIDMVDAGSWTLEEMYKLCTDYGVVADNGDGVMDANDQYAVAVYTSTIYGVYASCGQNFSTFDEAGDITVDLATDASIHVLEELVKLYNPDLCLMSKAQIDASNLFTAGRSLFLYNTSGYMIDHLPSSPIDYNIIPCPKFTEEQEYVTCAWPNSNYCVAIQGGLSENDRGFSGLMLEAYCHLSEIYVKPAKFGTIVSYQLAQNADTNRMLDLIFDTLYFDMNLIFDFGGTRTIINDRLAASNLGRFTTLIERAAGSVEKDIQNLISKSDS